MNILCAALGVIFCIAGIAFWMGKGHIHLKAWKSMSEEERMKIKIVPLCRNIGMMIIFCGVIFLLGGFWSTFKSNAFIWAMVLWMLVTGIDVYFIGKSNRYC